jgi:hypothetical protein
MKSDDLGGATVLVALLALIVVLLLAWWQGLIHPDFGWVVALAAH